MKFNQFLKISEQYDQSLDSGKEATGLLGDLSRCIVYAHEDICSLPAADQQWMECLMSRCETETISQNKVPAKLEGSGAVSQGMQDLYQEINVEDVSGAPDLWSGIEAKLDSQYHQEIWSETFGQTPHEKYLYGLSEYIDDQCSAAQHARISGHLAECADCRKLYNQMSKLPRILAYAYSDAGSVDIWPGVDQILFGDQADTKQQNIAI